jgi:hypothetical protein
MKLLKILKGMIDPYENYQPSPTLPTFNFCNVQQAKLATTTTQKDSLILPENVTEKITSVGVKYEKRTDTDTSVEFEVWGDKKALLTESELNEILKLFPKIDKNAMVITKRAWSKGATVAQTITELKKSGLSYGKTYITTMRTIFNKNRVETTG